MTKRFPPATCSLLPLLWTMLIALNWSQAALAQTCDPGWFGSDCQYKCRCMRNTCDRDGMCQDRLCHWDWFGPECQFANLLGYIKDDWLHDANENTCNQDKSVTSVTVNMRSELPFTWLRLQVKDPSLLQEFQVTFTDKRNERNISCKDMRNATVNDRTLDIHCDLDVLVQYVILKGDGVKSLCSLYISGGRNVALRQKTNQSSTYYYLTYSLNMFAADNAVDGKRDNDWKRSSCTSTDDGDKAPTWTVTLSSAYMINRYVVYNRFRTWGGRIIGFTLRSFTNEGMELFNYTDMKKTSSDVYTITNVPARDPVSLVEIQADNTKTSDLILNFCELELYGDSACEPSMYGRECQHKCNCAVEGESCFVSTGGCPSRCAAGFQGENCNKPCDFGKYGRGCNSNCSQFCVTTNSSESPCHHTDGTCVHGCISGYQAPVCVDILMKEDDSIPLVAVVVPVLAAVILVVLAVLGVILWRRCRKTSDKQASIVVNKVGNKTCNHYKHIDDRELEPTNAHKRSEHHQAIAMNQVNTPKQTTNNIVTQNNSNDNVYNNTVSGMSSTSIAVRDLSSLVASRDKAFFLQQFNSIPANNNATTNTGTKEENKHKNRYKNICAYDHSRVVLKINNATKWGDYINASYIDGYKGQRTFIASQGPTKAILEDFVRMLSEQNVEVVVMLTNLAEDGKIKCEQYWPEDDVMQVGDIKVKLTTTQVFADYTIRRLQLLREGDSVQELTQFHFTAWPDKDVPTTEWSLVDFEQRVSSISTDKPVVVHCSAGVGRTGTFIALSNIVMEAMGTGYIDFFTEVQKLRHNRTHMVQTSNQYEFLHRAALVANVCMGTTVVSSTITERIKELNNTAESGESKLDQEFKTICDICDDGRNHYEDKDFEHSSNAYENNETVGKKLKNRFQNVSAKDDYRVMLMGDSDEGLGDYINAVFLPSFSRKNQQILTQIPLPATVTDFWRMVTQYQVTLVVAFEADLVNADSSIGIYFPWKENEEVSTPYFTIKSQQTSSCVLWSDHKILVTINTPKKTTTDPGSRFPDKEHKLRHITCNGTLTNLNPADLLALMKVVRSFSPVGGGRVVYMCRNGAEYSGLVCVLSLLLDRLDNDHHLTVPLVVGAIKAIRPQVIPTAHQYSVLYQVLMMYNDSNNVYSNFGK